MMKSLLAYCLLFLLPAAGLAHRAGTDEADQQVEIERGSSVKLHARSDSNTRFQWFKDGVPVEAATGDSFSASQPGFYTVVAFNESSCSSEMSNPVHVIFTKNSILPDADLGIRKSAEIRPVGENEPFEYRVTVTNHGPAIATDVTVRDVLPPGLLLNEIRDATHAKPTYNAQSHTISWALPTLAKGESADLYFTAMAEKAGTVKSTATVASNENDPIVTNNTTTNQKEILPFSIPNIFTPNGDGINDRFAIRGLDGYAGNELLIINRWGNTVYQKVNYQGEWNGEGADDGTYYYILKVKTRDGIWKTHKGYVTIMKSAN